MRKLATVILLSASLLAAACNTVKGAGEDIESVGKKGEDIIN
jgi:predicted small secreted protein